MPEYEDLAAALREGTDPDDLSSIGYPSKVQVERAIGRVRDAGQQVTATAIADEIEAGCGLRPGDDVVVALLKQYRIEV